MEKANAMPVHPTAPQLVHSTCLPPSARRPPVPSQVPCSQGGPVDPPAAPPLLLRAAAVDAEGRHVPAALQPPLQAALEGGAA